MEPLYIGLFGSSGAGKSTLLNTILGKRFFLPVSGTRTCTSCQVHVSVCRSKHYEAKIFLLSDEVRLYSRSWHGKVPSTTARGWGHPLKRIPRSSLLPVPGLWYPPSTALLLMGLQTVPIAPGLPWALQSRAQFHSLAPPMEMSGCGSLAMLADMGEPCSTCTAAPHFSPQLKPLLPHQNGTVLLHIVLLTVGVEGGGEEPGHAPGEQA